MLPGLTHQGVVARTAASGYHDAEELLERLASMKDTERQPLVLGLDAIEDPRNLGAILRTAECAGVDGVFIPERRAVGLTATVAKASAGALEHVAAQPAMHPQTTHNGIGPCPALYSWETRPRGYIAWWRSVATPSFVFRCAAG
jgi:tRNA G18 (ribose-2'-O)-methylase SpoU